MICVLEAISLSLSWFCNMVQNHANLFFLNKKAASVIIENIFPSRIAKDGGVAAIEAYLTVMGTLCVFEAETND